MNVARLETGVDLSGFLGGELGAQQCHFIVRHYQPAALGDVVAGLAIDGDLDIGFFFVALLGRRRQCQLDRLKDNVFRHPLLIGYSLRDQQNFLCHL